MEPTIELMRPGVDLGTRSLPAADLDGAGRPASASIRRPSDDRRLPVTAYLERVIARHQGLRSGAVATYIPELSKADPSWFGVSLATVEGAVYEAGDSRQPFTIQSISKPLTYALALEAHGEAAVRSRIGVEPTGEPFNAITLAQETGTPLNPMVNAGAIAAAALLVGQESDRYAGRLLDTYSRFAGRSLGINRRVFESEKATGHRNRAIGHLLRGAGAIDGDPHVALDLYFQQCSVEIECRDLAVIAATLANGGINPVTGDRVVRPEVVRSVLSVMTTCGMYDGAGEWLYAVGVPAKSGVSGGIMAVLPGRIGIGVFSPPLDAHGNSVRGLAVCRDLSKDLDLHLVAIDRPSVSPVRASATIAERPSTRWRDAAQRVVLEQVADGGRVLDLHGDVSFRSAEVVSRMLLESHAVPELVVLDLRRVERVDRTAIPILADLAGTIAMEGGEVVLAEATAHAAAVGSLDLELASRGLGAIRTFAEADHALEWAEDRLLSRHGGAADPDEVPIERHELVAGLPPADVDAVRRLLVRWDVPAGTVLVRAGTPGDALCLLTRGRLSVSISLPDGRRRRVAMLTPGSVFGELGFLDGAPRTADVVAETDAEVWWLTRRDLHAAATDAPTLPIAIYANLARIVAGVARRMTDQLARAS